MQIQKTKWWLLLMSLCWMSFQQGEEELYKQYLDLKKEIERINESGDYKGMYPVFEKQIAILSQMDKPAELGDVYASRSELLYLDGRLDESRESSIKAIPLLERAGNYVDLCMSYCKVSGVFRMEGNIDSSFHYLRIAQSLLPLTEDIKALYNVYNQLGFTYRGMGQLDSAAHYQLKLIEIINPEKVYPLGAAYKNISATFSIQGNYEKALEYLDRNLEMLPVEEFPLSIANSLKSKASILSKTGDLQTAHKTINQAIEYFEASNRPRHLMPAYSTLSSILLKKGELAEARMAFDKIDFKAQNNDTEYSGNYYLTKIRLFLAENRINEILPLLKEANPIIEGSYALGDKIIFTKLQQEYYEKIGDTKSSLFHLKRNQVLKDSLFDSRRTQIVHNLEAKYENEKKAQEIAQLKLEDDLSQAQLSRQRGIIGFITAGLLLFGGLFWRIRSQNLKIQTQNQVITKSLNEKNILLKEIHHRVKNNLQVISSLLGIQSRKIKDKVALSAIQEGRTRVHSMSLIHQNLYKEDNLTGIELQQYLQQLCLSLFNTYNINEKRIKLTTDIEPLVLDVDSVVPLGLILNELITNALKYAFPDNRKGEIKITLQEKTDGLFLSVEDDGIGIEDTDKLLDGDTFGYDLIDAFKHKLNADLKIEGSNGTSIKMLIKKYNTITTKVAV